MSFNSLEYVLFLPLVVVLFYGLPQRYRWVLLLIASYVFYVSWRVEYIVLVLASTLIDYLAALRIHAGRTEATRWRWLMFSVSINVGLLITFKYLEPAFDGINKLLAWGDAPWRLPLLDILLPIGISFYTFQTLSYTIDVYRGVSLPERNLGLFALYVSFFPQLVSGPIERSTTLLPQFSQSHRFDPQGISDALKLIVWGYFQKLVVADRLAIYVDQVFQNPESHSGAPVLLSIYFFAWQVFHDFSGYTNIAIGSAKLMGFELSENFARPYLAPSIPEFWRRWHMTLTSWFRDYVYFSLGGSRAGWWRRWVNLYTVFFLVAIWHGTDWKLTLFATAHFSLYVLTPLVSRAFQAMLCTVRMVGRDTIQKILGCLITFHLVAYCWVIWWADSLPDVGTIYLHSLRGVNYSLAGIDILEDSPGLVATLLLLAFCGMVSLLQGGHPERHFLMHRPRWVRWLILYLLLAGLLFLRPDQGSDAFIYFQF
jgi:alginate O-acetyltransferase complex protein AlgI